ncbi:hypothetical protein CTAYLR_009803 [Chrysophaeum taylorii]|uniref:Phytanoyl-CoA dioxygenase n=1 Tax=Chrysophaeum taylorii TaxID=2483200 RepID=A0AAD7UN55_9STRA|nr:hypothetical protein CTAYLR_009803 [Chrysophaeum taylorii]
MLLLLVGLREAFDHDGFAVVENFSDAAELGRMRSRIAEVVALNKNRSVGAVFRTDEGQAEAQAKKSQYFLDSAEKIHLFEEPGGGLNKIGHGLHLLDPVFEAYSFSDKVSRVLETLGYVDPRLPQSMYIFKSKHTGGAVTSHQDATFLATSPRQTVVGLWLAIDDASADNGCLWARSGSHREPLRRKFVRRRDNVMEMDTRATPHPWEGRNIEYEDARRAGFQPIPAKAGTLVVISGTLDHLSFPNTSPFDRHTFQLHAIEGADNGISWDSSNWLQTKSGTFPSLRRRNHRAADL